MCIFTISSRMIVNGKTLDLMGHEQVYNKYLPKFHNTKLATQSHTCHSEFKNGTDLG